MFIPQKVLTTMFLLLSAICVQAQDDLKDAVAETNKKNSEKVTATFKTSRLINFHSNETVGAHDLDFRVDHLFGDLAGASGGYQNYWGLTNASDIRIGFEYGVTNKLTTAFGLVKGVGEQRLLWDVYAKYKLLQQNVKGGSPIAVTLLTDAAISTISASTDATSAASFTNTAQRLSYNTQAIIARKFNNSLSATLIPTYIHRNFVRYGEQNNLFALGMGFRYKLTKRFGVVVDYALPFRSEASKNILKTYGTKFYNPLGVGIEIETGGHVFHINFTNKEAMLEQQFISSNTKNWGDGQFRWGFNMSRTFTLF
jgi:hypothetical protein